MGTLERLMGVRLRVISLAPFLNNEFLHSGYLIIATVYNQYLTLAIVNTRLLSINNHY